MTPPDEQIKTVIDKFAAAGVKFELKVGANVADDTWSGLIDPSNPKEWFENYTFLIKKWASYAQDRGCDRLIITNEMWTLTAKYPELWGKLVDDVRTIFKGQIGVNAVVNPDEARHLSFADKLDFIGLSVYVATTTKTSPTVEELVAGWSKDVTGVNWIQRIKDIHDQYKKPVQITEMAFFAYDGAASQANYYNGRDRAVDLDEQNTQYEAFFRVFTNLPSSWFEGATLWRWIDRQPEKVNWPDGLRDAFIDGRPAEQTVRDWLSGNRQSVGLLITATDQRPIAEGGYNHDTLVGSSGTDLLSAVLAMINFTLKAAAIVLLGGRHRQRFFRSGEVQICR